MIKSILTHPGGAHKDDFMACAVLLTQAPVAIQRREPTEADLADANIAVLDVGGEHAPERSNFDHHQFPRDMVPTCALSLVLQHLGIYEDAKEFCSWLEVAEWFDCRGPNDTAEWLGMDRETIGKLNSPLDITILRRFASQTEHKPGEPIWEIMRMIGQDLVDYVTNLRTRLDFVAQHAEVWEFDGFKALFMPRTEPMPDEASAGLGGHVMALGLEEEILALVYPDSRGTGYGMRRFNDDQRMDFSPLENEEDVHFAHARGFIAKTSSADVERLKVLVSTAYIGEA
ncbi:MULTISPECIES: MYG1 family protein [unclassified Lentimonas]|uniref:MYG1 family protein n=1 Tax=unclassified Lentimonas TaxID=2630993 RepID=UPI001FD55B65|nr:MULTISPECIES: MYG1 family protein [unclassified Lentimonas]